MKNWKAIVALIVIVGVIVTILAINKKKLSANTSGGITDVIYVSVEKAAKKNISSTLSLTGTILANNDVNILSETSGKVTEVFVKVGDYKTAGAILFQVDDELRKAAFMSAEANYEKAKKDYERFQILHQQKTVSDTQFDQAKLAAAMAESQYIVAKRQLEDTKIKTPIAGYITSKNVDIGSMVQGAPQPTFVANVVDISSLKVKVNVSETDVFALKTGDPVNVTTDVFPGIIFKGRIESISSKSDEAHTYPIEIRVANQSSHQLKAGMFARVEFTTQKERATIVIPREAVIGSVKDPQVYIVENGFAKIRKIVVGGELGTSVSVLSGLTEGETVVINGQNNLVDNIKVETLSK
jgi:RND family efflux transporter MFP subunit